MAIVGKTITIDFDSPRQTSLRTWLASLPPEMRKLPPLTIAVSVNVDLDAFSDDEIVDWYEEHFETDAPWAERLYRLIATGETDEALDLLYREAPEGLAPPVHREAHRGSSHRPEGFHPCLKLKRPPCWRR